ncbi:type II toxin-antitoxin system HicB family antitoxin [Methanocalculus sp. MC3]
MPYKIIVEEDPNGYIAYPIGLNGVVVAEGDTYEEVLAEIRSAIQFHIESFVRDAFVDVDTMEAFIAEVAGKRPTDR